MQTKYFVALRSSPLSSTFLRIIFQLQIGCKAEHVKNEEKITKI